MTAQLENTLLTFLGARPRAQRGGVGLRILCAVLLLALASPAFAAKIEEVRIGKHPEFTRIVFQLDEQAGYRIARKDRELVVTLDATSTSQKLGKRGSIQSVTIDGGTDASIARIQLNQSSVRIQEMILANPPRIVLDLMSDAPVAKATQPALKPAAVKPAPAAETPKPTAVNETAKPAVAETPKPAPVTKVAQPAVKPAAVAETPKPAPVAPPAVAETEPAPATSAPEPATAETQAKKDLYAVDPSDEPGEAPRSFVKAKPAKPNPKEAEASAKPASKPAADGATASPFGTRLVDPMVIAAAAAALVVITVVFVMLRRRRSIPNDDDVMAFAGEDDDDDAAFSYSAASSAANSAAPQSADNDDDDLFGDLGSDSFSNSPSAGSRSTAASESSMFGDDPTTSASANQGDSMMSQETSGMQGSVDITRIVQELQSRMAALETKLEESNEARDRLERQVAAQSEELRVQRAAIARTQRALRSMSRGDEDKATEPALKDADTQMKTRING